MAISPCQPLWPAAASELSRRRSSFPTPLGSFPPRQPSLNHPAKRGRTNCSCAIRTHRGRSSYRDVSCAAGKFDAAGPSLAHICHKIEFCFFEVCIQNLGRPIASALHGFVSAAMEAFSCGYTRDQLTLQLAFGSTAMHEFEVGTPGNRLTSTEEHYRSQWLDTVYTTLQILNDEGKEGSKLPPATNIYLYGTIKHILEGQKSGDEQVG